MALPDPSNTAVITLASLAVHVDEFLSPGGCDTDRLAIQGCLENPEVRDYLMALDALALLPVKRSGERYWLDDALEQSAAGGPVDDDREDS